MTDDRTEFEKARQIGLERRQEQRLAHLPTHLRGDGPCQTCGTENNIVWFTENAFWNAVVRNSDPDTKDQILCIQCFVKLVDLKGYHVTGWQLTPEWHWETKGERDARREASA